MKTLLTIIAAVLFALSTQAAELNLTWQDHSDNEDGFRIERATGEGPFQLIGKVDSDVVTYKDTQVIPGKSYSYRVNAYNASGDSGFSNVAEGKVESTVDLKILPQPEVPPIPNVPGTVVITTITTIEVQ